MQVSTTACSAALCTLWKECAQCSNCAFAACCAVETENDHSASSLSSYRPSPPSLAVHLTHTGNDHLRELLPSSEVTWDFRSQHAPSCMVPHVQSDARSDVTVHTTVCDKGRGSSYPDAASSNSSLCSSYSMGVSLASYMYLQQRERQTLWFICICSFHAVHRLPVACYMLWH